MEFEVHGPWWENLDPADDEGGDVNSTESGWPEAPSYFGGVPLLVIGSEGPVAVWGWSESTPMPFTLADLHSRWGIGSDAFVCNMLATNPSSLAPQAGASTDPPAFDAIMLTHDDEVLLDAAASELTTPGHPLCDRVLGEMLGVMFEVVHSAPSEPHFTFAFPRHWPGI